MEKKSAPDARIAVVAARQHGVVSIRQLRAAGLGETAVHGRLRTGRLHRMHRGVYAVGHSGLSEEGRLMAAVLAFPPQSGEPRLGSTEAAISHRSAAVLWGLLSPADGPVDVSLPGRSGRRRRRGIRVHRPVSLGSAEVTRQRGIPVTSPARTIADLGSVVPARDLRRAIRQAEVLGLPLGVDVHKDRTRSELEHLFLRLCQRHRLPTPETNVRIGSLTVDFLWRDRRLIVETDGYRYHRGRLAFEKDRTRDLRLRALGYEVVRLSYRQVVEEPGEVAVVLGAALRDRRSWR